MPERISATQRSRNMAAIRSQHTAPELLLQHELYARGFRFRLHDKELPGKPDLVLPRWRVAIFVHGCFWHAHGCQFSRMPATNTGYWARKLSRNAFRDAVAQLSLISAGWRVAVVWECASRRVVARRSYGEKVDEIALWIRSTSSPSYCEISMF